MIGDLLVGILLTTPIYAIGMFATIVYTDFIDKIK